MGGRKKEKTWYHLSSIHARLRTCFPIGYMHRHTSLPSPPPCLSPFALIPSSPCSSTCKPGLGCSAQRTKDTCDYMTKNWNDKGGKGSTQCAWCVPPPKNYWARVKNIFGFGAKYVARCISCENVELLLHESDIKTPRRAGRAYQTKMNARRDLKITHLADQ